MSNGTNTLPKLLNTILNSFIELCACDGGSIYTVRKHAHGPDSLVFESMVTKSIRIQQVPEHLKNLAFKFDDSSLVGKTATLRQVFKVAFRDENGKTSPRVDSLLNYKTRNIMSAPLVTPRGDLVGVVQLLNKNPYSTNSEPDFDDRDERLFSIVAAQAALAIENSLLMEEQERLLEGFVNAFVTAVESRDPVTSGHSHRVSDYTVALTDAVSRDRSGPLKDLVFNDTQIREIRFAAMLHDIGKISVREAVLMKEKKLMPFELEMIRMRMKLMRAEVKLHQQVSGSAGQSHPRYQAQLEKIDLVWKIVSEANEPTVLPMAVNTLLKELQQFQVESLDGEILRGITPEEGFKLSIQKGSLTAAERREIETHVQHTFEILKMVPWSKGLEKVPEIAHYHHEKLDGTGYPCAIEEPLIPVQSRMMAICDIYDALTADDRPYKKAVPVSKALDILGAEVKSGKLDGRLLDVFLAAKVYETPVYGKIKPTGFLTGAMKKAA